MELFCLYLDWLTFVSSEMTTKMGFISLKSQYCTGLHPQGIDISREPFKLILKTCNFCSCLVHSCQLYLIYWCSRIPSMHCREWPFNTGKGGGNIGRGWLFLTFKGFLNHQYRPFYIKTLDLVIYFFNVRGVLDFFLQL